MIARPALRFTSSRSFTNSAFVGCHWLRCSRRRCANLCSAPITPGGGLETCSQRPPQGRRP
jgi:hypothetical protein